MSTQHVQYVLLLLVLVVNSKFYGVTRSYSSHPFLCALVTSGYDVIITPFLQRTKFVVSVSMPTNTTSFPGWHLGMETAKVWKQGWVSAIIYSVSLFPRPSPSSRLWYWLPPSSESSLALTRTHWWPPGWSWSSCRGPGCRVYQVWQWWNRPC